MRKIIDADLQLGRATSGAIFILKLTTSRQPKDKEVTITKKAGRFSLEAGTVLTYVPGEGEHPHLVDVTVTGISISRKKK